MQGAEGNAGHSYRNNIELLFGNIKSGKYSKVLRKLLLGKDRQGRTAWHVTAENGSVEAFKKVGELSEVSVKRLVWAKL